MNNTGDCYEAAARFVMKHHRDLGLILCHGTCTCTGAGELAGLPIGHAWVETGDTQLVFDVANGRENVVRRRDYYRVGQCRDVRRYNFDAMRKMMLQHEHYGPWHETDAVHRDWKPIRKKSIDTKQARC